MPSTLIIPGVQVRAEFEPSPVLPGATGILGVIGIVDRGPLLPTPVGSFGEFIDLFGPASSFTMPEVRTAFANGVAQVVVARVLPGRGQKGKLELTNDAGENVATLEARAEGAWAERIAVRVTQVKTLSGRGVKYVNLVVTYNGQTIDTLNNLVMDYTSPNYFFDRINSQSRLLTAVDPAFQKALPGILAKTALINETARVATASLKAGANDVLNVSTKQVGSSGNLVSIQVKEGQAALSLKAADNTPSIEILARQAGAVGTNIVIAVTSAGDDGVRLTVGSRVIGPFKTVKTFITHLERDPDVMGIARGELCPR